MEAAFYKQTEPSEQVLVVGDLPDPQPATGEVRVRLQWSGLNPSNVKARAGARGPVKPFPRVIPHCDGMGVVDAVGAVVDATRIGLRVWLWKRSLGPAVRHCRRVRCVCPSSRPFPCLTTCPVKSARAW